jgi:hypothetical protein
MTDRSAENTKDHMEVTTMKRNKKRVIAAVAVIAALAAGGAAFTATISGTAIPSGAVAGFAQTKINGARATALQWQLSQDRQYVTTVTMTLGADGTNGTTAGDPLPVGSVVKAGFNSGGAGAIEWATCTTSDHQAYSCDLTAAHPTTGTPVTSGTLFNVSVTDGTSN